MASISYKQFTLGVEEEYMVIDPVSRELKSHEQKIVEEGQKVIKEKVKAEMHQAVVEVGTDICNDVDEAFMDVSTLRKTISSIADSLGLKVGASGTHPFSHWESQLITEHIRYNEIINELQEAARSNLIFGLHVHVGMETREMAIHIANSVRYFLPHVFALSTNSPFWEGRTTGYKSFRTKVFEKFHSEEKFKNEYNNSISYTDYILEKIIRKVEVSNSIVLYLSDHGQSIMDGAYRHSTTKKGFDVPFFIWHSDSVDSKYKLSGETNSYTSITNLYSILENFMGIEGLTPKNPNDSLKVMDGSLKTLFYKDLKPGI